MKHPANILLQTCLFASLLTSCRSLPTLDEAEGNTPAQIMQSLSDRYLQTSGNSGIAMVAILPDGSDKSAFAGVADPNDPQIPLSENTLFEIGSLGKDFITWTIWELEKERRINLDSPVTAYADQPLPSLYETVLVRDLLTHHSGLPRESLGLLDMDDVLDAWLWTGDICRCVSTRDRLYGRLRNRRCLHAIENRHSRYSNIGFGLLGMLMENATGEQLEQLIQHYVTTPMNLSDTTFSPTEEQRKRLAAPVAGDLPVLFRRGTQVPVHQLGNGLKAAGNLYSTPNDMKKFIRRFHTELLTRAPVVPNTPEMNGQLIYNREVHITPENHRLLCRWGMFYGYNAFVGLDLDTGISILVFRTGTDWPDEFGITVLRALSRTARS
ncbi:MAG: beta-lactamase family protein [Kiritimatiellae bacterium]|nr:beta-lactamase family protein [Kiritimatiellia bacterium]